MISDEELNSRKKTMSINPKKSFGGYIGRYMRYVSSAEKGAIVE